MKGKITIISAICAIFIGMIPVNAQFKNGASYADLNDSETIRAFKEHVSTISAAVMEGRKAGSEGERMTAEYVTGIFKKYGVDVLSGKDGDVFGIRQENGEINKIRITPDSVDMEYSTCENQDCIGEGTITLDNYNERILGTWIICLPNQVTIEMVPADE